MYYKISAFFTSLLVTILMGSFAMHPLQRGPRVFFGMPDRELVFGEVQQIGCTIFGCI
jgi:hypothetical protein